MHTSTNAAEAAIEAVRAQGRRVILKRGWAELDLIDDQDDCFIVDEINQQALFPHTAAIVHHGGSGTTMTATRAGTPQVVVPQLADQPYWAGRVADLGIGIAHDGPTLTTESLSTALKAALNLKPQAQAIAAKIRTDGTAVAAELLLDGSR
jgi:vancomycin aglycone glucosyltransferase